MRKIILQLAVLISIVGDLFAQKVEFRAWVDTNRMLIGDQIHLSLEAKAPPSINLIFPDLMNQLNKFEIIHSTKIDTNLLGEVNKYSQKITLTTFDTGFIIIPPIKLLFEGKSISGFDSVQSDSIRINVASIPVDTTKDIKDIKSIIEVPLSFWDYFVFVIYFLLLVGIGYGIYYFVKKKRKVKKDRPKISVPPHVWAINELKRLDEEKLWQKGDFKLFHIRLTEIIRTYIELQLNILALEMTSSEIIEAIRSENKIPNELMNRFTRFLEISDLVKFAKYTPFPDENSFCFKAAFDFVDATKPIENSTNADLQTNSES